MPLKVRKFPVRGGPKEFSLLLLCFVSKPSLFLQRYNNSPLLKFSSSAFSFLAFISLTLCSNLFFFDPLFQFARFIFSVGVFCAISQVGSCGGVSYRVGLLLVRHFIYALLWWQVFSFLVFFLLYLRQVFCFWLVYVLNDLHGCCVWFFIFGFYYFFPCVFLVFLIF